LVVFYVWPKQESEWFKSGGRETSERTQVQVGKRLREGEKVIYVGRLQGRMSDGR
jgi:hypothetical protein